MKEWAASADTTAIYGPHMMKKGVYSFQRPTYFKFQPRSLVGAEGVFESGAASSRVTATRVVAGAVIAGPLGVLVGALAKKDRTKVFAILQFGDGEQVIVEGPLKDEAKLRRFVHLFNQAAEKQTAEA